jgi:hypothetical protein
MSAPLATILSMTALGLRWMVDTNFFPFERSSACHDLMQMHRAGLILLARTDVADTELLKAPEDERPKLQAQSSELSEYLGPLVLDHSRLGSSVLGSEEDQMLLETVFSTLFPGRAWASGNSHDQRDAMHVAWAKREAFDGFITDEKQLLRRNDAMRKKYNGFSILSPEDALTIRAQVPSED